MTTNTTTHCDVRDWPNYTLSEASRWLPLSSRRLRCSLRGPRRAIKTGTGAPPIVRLACVRPPTLSFWNLVECGMLATIPLQRALSLPKVGHALAFVAGAIGNPRPLLAPDFGTHGAGRLVEQYGKLIGASKKEQVAIHDGLLAALSRLGRDTAGLPSRLFPWRCDPREPRIVVIDPAISFGQPVLVGTRVPVEILFDRYRAGDSMDRLAQDHRVQRAVLEDLAKQWFGASAA